MRAIMIEEFGGPEVLQVRDDVPDPEWKPGMALVEVHSAGVNYADTHATDNSYLSPQTLPFIPGSEVVGRIIRGPEEVESSSTESASHHRQVLSVVEQG